MLVANLFSGAAKKRGQQFKLRGSKSQLAVVFHAQKQVDWRHNEKKNSNLERF